MKLRLGIISIIFVNYSFSNCGIQSKVKSSPITESAVFNKLYSEAGNCFYINSIANSITCWTYREKEIYIYEVKKNKIIKKVILPYTDESELLSSYQKAELTELDQCLELDGSNFGFKIKKVDEVITKNIPINIECFIGKSYNSRFLNILNSDIKKYQLK